jgi:hypothetical protein
MATRKAKMLLAVPNGKWNGNTREVRSPVVGRVVKNLAPAG